jgi:phosphatidylserine/phosphatidylglycerophosphate/cardiolipin synthase-like enzyme
MTRSSALVREAAIKRLPRPKKEKLLQAALRALAVGLIVLCASALRADLRDRIVDHIEKAGSSIDLAVYEIRSNEIVDALISAKHRGVRVRILVDSVHSPVATPQEKVLEEEDIAVKRVRGISHDLMHDKFILFDGSVASTPSYNRSAKSLRAKDEEEAAFTHDKALIEKLKVQFENFWNHTDQDEVPANP